MENLEAMSEEALVQGLRSTLDEALKAEAKDNIAAAVAKTAAIKNIQKALTEVIKDENKARALTDHIINSRKTKEKVSLKRTTIRV